MFGTDVILKTFHGALVVTRSTVFNYCVFSLPRSGHHAIAIARTKVNLNFVVNDSGCSDRVYQILAAGGFLLSEDWPGWEHDFVDGQDLVIFYGLNDLNRKIHFYLEHETKRMVIAEQEIKSVQRFTRVEFARKIIALAESVEEAK